MPAFFNFEAREFELEIRVRVRTVRAPPYSTQAQAMIELSIRSCHRESHSKMLTRNKTPRSNSHGNRLDFCK